MQEIYRICKPDANIVIKVPHFSGKSAFFEFHKRFFRYDSFADFEKKEGDMFTTEGVKLKVTNRKISFLKRWYYPWNYLVEPIVNLTKGGSIIYEETFLRNLFPAHEVGFVIKPIK